MSKKQETLFNIWGNKANDGRKVQLGSCSQPCIESEACAAGVQTLYGDQGEDFAFLEDEVTDAQLLEVCDLTEEGCSKTNYESNPQSSESSVAFHIGPSASDHSILNLSIVEDSIPGFDPQAGEMWIYPTNYPVRDYQFNIVSKALYINTLVSLPTGLGKTFIAAVVMYNYYRWYPSGKVIFLAPTKPLVAQQIEACFRVMGIPQDHATEMTGSMMPKDRVLIWQTKHVFFLTPQVMQNDLSRGACPAMAVSCVVFDEAHKALGNHAYCQVIRELAAAGGHYRVLALSATPGNDLKAVQQVVTNLQISHIELRSEDSFDIQPFVHERKVEKIVIPLVGEILDIKNRFEKVLSGVLERLHKCRVLYHAIPDRMSKFQLLQAREQFRKAGPPEGVMPGVVEGDFALSISLFHAFELLQLHGMHSFHQFLKNTFCSDPFPRQSIAKQDIIRSPIFKRIMKQLASKFQGTCSDGIGDQHFPITVDINTKMEEDTSKEGERRRPNFFYSHPKLEKLEEIMLEHFRPLKDGGGSSSVQGPVTTRVMIFSEYRESVQEISNMLSRHIPLIRAMTFVGHSGGKSTSKGLTQKEQTEIVRKFREGGYNTLVATCVGEEGLDIGEVDLIICFDAAKSPIRLVQRMGRTGRKRSGRIVVLVAAGKEESIYNRSQSSKKSIHRAISEGCKKLQLYQHSPRMVPRHIRPRVHKMHMTIKEFVDTKVTRKLASGKEGSMASRTKLGVALRPRINGGKNMFLNQQQLSYWSKELALSDREFRAIEKSVGRCLSNKASFLSIGSLRDGTSKDLLDLNASHSIFSDTHRKSITPPSARNKGPFLLRLDKWTHLQTAPIPTKVIGHSSKSHALMCLLEFADLLQTSEGMGESYDLEMRTFLNKADIKPSSSGSLLPTTSAGEKRAGASTVKKKRRVIVDLSDDEDFLDSTMEKLVAPSPQMDTALNAEVQELEVIMADARSYGSISEKLGNKNPSHTSSNDDPNERVKKGDGDKSHRCDYFTASQHVVPRPPMADSLSWLDEIEPSQSQMNLSPPSRYRTGGLGRGEGKGRADGEKEEQDFRFITPSSPLCRRRSRVFSTSTPDSSTSTQRKKLCGYSALRVASENRTDVYHESNDLFDDLSVRDIFDEFSVSGLQGVQDQVNSSGRKTGGTGKKEGENVMLRDIGIIPGDMNLPMEEGMTVEDEKRLTGRDEKMDDHRVGMVEDEKQLTGRDEKMDDSVGITVISESDIEQLEDEDQSRAGKEVENCCPHDTATRDTAGGFCEEIQQNNSYQLHVGRKGRKRRKIIQFLESPSPQDSLVERDEENQLHVGRKGRKRRKIIQFLESPSPQDSLVERDKEENMNRRKMDENTEDASTTSLNLRPSASLAAACELEPKCSGDKNFPIVLDSSEDDDDMPIIKRIRTTKRGKKKCDFDVATDSRWGQKVSEFVEEEAQVSSEEEEKAGLFEEEEGSGDDYDMEDSFINDNSILTQYIPKRGKKKCDFDVATDSRWGQKVSEFVEEEAQVSSEEEEKAGGLFEEEEGSGDDYDMEDSFINDNSILTQYIPNQKSCEIKAPAGSAHHSTSERNIPYPLCSQRDDIFTRRKCHAARSKYRMVFSQRYHLLQHYLDEVDTSKTNDRQKLQGKRNLVDKFCDMSGSEAEEVNVAYGEEEEEWDELTGSLLEEDKVEVAYGEEGEWDELSRSLLEAEESALIKFDCVGDDTVAICGDKSNGGRDKGKRRPSGGHKRKARVLSDSEENLEKFGEDVQRSENPLNLCIRDCEDRLAAKSEAGSSRDEEKEEREKEVRFVDISRFENVVISPSLLKDVKIVRTPPFFSPGMEDWLTIIDYEDDQAATVSPS